MRRFMLAVFITLIILFLTWGAGNVLLMNYPGITFTGRPMAMVAGAVVVLFAAVMLVTRKPPETRHVVLGMLLGAASTALLLNVSIGEGWRDTAYLVGLVLIIVVWAVIVTIIESVLMRRRWPWVPD